MAELPTGTVTFLRTDVEGSMRLVRELGPRWDAVNAAHMDVIRRSVHGKNRRIIIVGNPAHVGVQARFNFRNDERFAIFCREDEVRPQTRE